MFLSDRFNKKNLISLIYLICKRKLDMCVHSTFFVGEGHTIITLSYRFGRFLSFAAFVNTCLTRANQINISQYFKRFMSATTSEIINIREGRHK